MQRAHGNDKTQAVSGRDLTAAPLPHEWNAILFGDKARFTSVRVSFLMKF